MNHIYRYTIQETDLDFLGHVNNATYIKIFEQARWQLTYDRGISLKRIQELKQSPIILAINISYLKELTARQEINIHTEFLKYKGKIGKISQKMLIEGTEIVASTAEITFGLFDMRERKLIEPTGEWLSALSANT